MPGVAVEIRILAAGDAGVLARVAPEVFDRGIDMARTVEFLADPRHHLAVAIEDAADVGDAGDPKLVVGFASAVHYIHPDKPPELWINEVGVAATHRKRGVGRQLLAALLELGRTLGCGEAWVLTDRSNLAAMRLYASLTGAEPPRDQVMFTFKLG